MRQLLPLLLLCVLPTVAAPDAAAAATTPCGFLNGQFDVSGKRYAGTIGWPGDAFLDGPDAMTSFAVEATMSADCKVAWTSGGQTRSGTWMQKNENMVVKVGDVQMLIKVGADGALKGQAINDGDAVGKVDLKLR